MARVISSSLETRLGFVDISSEMEQVAWYKFMTIVPVFALQGSLNVNAEQMTDDSVWRIFYKQLIEETRNTAAAAGVKLEKHRMLKDYFLPSTDVSAALDAIHVSISSLKTPPVASLLQDLRRGKSITEADYTIGVMLQIAKQHGVEMLLTQDCYDAIKRIERQTLRRPGCPFCSIYT